MVSDIPDGDGKIIDLFLQCIEERVEEEMILVFKIKRWFRNAHSFLAGQKGVGQCTDKDEKASTLITAFLFGENGPKSTVKLTYRRKTS